MGTVVEGKVEKSISTRSKIISDNTHRDPNMKLLHRSLIEASKRLINKRATRTSSPDDRRAPHNIDSPFNISHPHRASSTPHLYILARTTPEGAIRKVSLTTHNDDGSIQSPGDATGYIVCSCPNASDASQHNHARLIPNPMTGEPTLKEGEHFVASTIVFPNVTSEAPLNRGIDLLIKLPDGTKAAEDLPRADVLDEMHKALHDFGSTDINDQIYSVRFTSKALGIISPPPTPAEGPGDYRAEVTEHRANLAQNWRKGYTEEESRTPSPTLSIGAWRQQRAFNPYHEPQYLSIDPPPAILVWTTLPHLAMALEIAIKQWDPAQLHLLRLDKIGPEHKGIIVKHQNTTAIIDAVMDDNSLTMAMRQTKKLRIGSEQLEDIRVATLSGEKPKAMKTQHIMTAPPAFYGILQSYLEAAPAQSEGNMERDRTTENDTQSDSQPESRRSQSESRRSGRSHRSRLNRRQRRQEQTGPREPHPRREDQQLSACPVCHMLFANPEATLKHVTQEHLNEARSGHTTAAPHNKTPTILKASQYNDDFVQVNLSNDQMANFFQATAESARDPTTNTRESRYIAPRFPNTIYDVEKLVAFDNIPQKEMEVWYKAFQQVTQSKQMGSYRTYQNHNIGVENTAASLLINGKKDTLNILKNQAPTIFPQKIAELNTHLVTRWFHNQRVYCLQNRIEWVSWFDICISERTAGREIYEQIMARLTAHPSTIDVLKTVSSYVENTVMQLLPHPVPFYQRRQEIIDMHASQLNSAIPSIDFTRQRLDADAEELKYLHPRYETSSQSTQASNLLQDTITDEILHQIVAESPFARRLQHLYLSDSTFQDIKQVPKAKILADLAKLIALDQATANHPAGATTMKTTLSSGPRAKQPARCKACQALNVKCPQDHCRLHQPTITQPQAQAIRQSGRNPAVFKQNCTGCQSVNTNNTSRNSPNRSGRAPSRSKSPGEYRSKQKQERNRSTSRTRGETTKRNEKHKSPQPKVRAILTNYDRQNDRQSTNIGERDNNPREWKQQTTETEGRRRSHYSEPPQRERDDRDHQSGDQWKWNYARESGRSSPRPRWQQRSPTPNTRPYQQRRRSNSPQYRNDSPHTYRPRSQSTGRYPMRDQHDRFPRNRSSSNDPYKTPRSQTPVTTPTQQ